VETDERAERAILSHAEAYRLVAEAQEQRARAEAAEARMAALEAAGNDLAAAYERHRTMTHKVELTFCHACRESTAAQERWRRAINGEPRS
jgi:hypothetical protein